MYRVAVTLKFRAVPLDLGLCNTYRGRLYSLPDSLPDERPDTGGFSLYARSGARFADGLGLNCYLRSQPRHSKAYFRVCERTMLRRLKSLLPLREIKGTVTPGGSVTAELVCQLDDFRYGPWRFREWIDQRDLADYGGSLRAFLQACEAQGVPISLYLPCGGPSLRITSADLVSP